MGFGFNFLVILFLFPLTAILALLWLATGKKLFGRLLALVWLPLFGLIFLISAVNFFTSKTVLDPDDIYGEYIIDRTKFPGKQADWQYDHFRIEITRENEFLFHLTEKEKIIRTYKGTITFLGAYRNPRIVVQVDTPRHHIINDNPTLYRNVWTFYYVFNSPKFGNVFFTKGHWEPIDR